MFIIRRIGSGLAVMLAMVFLVMLILDAVPGDPAALMLGENASPEMIAELRERMGLDRPLLRRYAEYAGRLLRGDLGRSEREMAPVSHLIRSALPHTLVLTAAAMVLTLILGVPLGILFAARPGSPLDKGARIVSLAALCTPLFLIGLVLIYLFSVHLGWLPAGGTGTPAHLILPAFTLSVHTAAGIARLTRSGVMEVLRENYMRTALAKGLSRGRAILLHGFPNAIIPLLTVLGTQTGRLLGGAVLIETVFSRPGMGRLIIGAVLERDYLLLQGSVLVFSGGCILVSLIADICCGLIDPRIWGV